MKPKLPISRLEYAALDIALTRIDDLEKAARDLLEAWDMSVEAKIHVLWLDRYQKLSELVR